MLLRSGPQKRKKKSKSLFGWDDVDDEEERTYVTITLTSNENSQKTEPSRKDSDLLTPMATPKKAARKNEDKDVGESNKTNKSSLESAFVPVLIVL